MPKRGRISGAVKRDVWLKYVGDKAKTKCFCCKKNEIMKEIDLEYELDSISRIEFINKHNLTEDFFYKLLFYGAQKRWVYD